MIAAAFGEWNNSVHPGRYGVDGKLAVLWGSLYDFSWVRKRESSSHHHLLGPHPEIA